MTAQSAAPNPNASILLGQANNPAIATLSAAFDDFAAVCYQTNGSFASASLAYPSGALRTTRSLQLRSK